MIWDKGQYFGYMKDSKPYGYGVGIDEEGEAHAGYWNGYGTPASKPYDAIDDDFQKEFNYLDYLKNTPIKPKD